MPRKAPEKKRRPNKQGDRSMVCYRSARVESVRRTRKDDADSPLEFEVRLSTDKAVEIYPGEFETLGHGDGEVRMDWMRSGNAPWLWMHRRDDQRGVITSAELRDGSIFVRGRLGTGAAARQLADDMEQEISRNVSIGYRVHAWELEREEDGKMYFRVTDWEPLEGSSVTIPADRDTGFGRSFSFSELLSEDETEKRSMAKPTTTPTKPDKPETSERNDTQPERRERNEPDVRVIEEARRNAIAEDRRRVSAIEEVGRQLSQNYPAVTEVIDEARNSDMSLADFNDRCLEIVRKNAPQISQQALGASEQEKKRYSLANVMNGLVNGDVGKRCAYELEVSEAIKERTGKGGEGIAIPTDVMLRGWLPKNPAVAAMLPDRQRDIMTVSLSGAGESNTVANVVETELLDELFVESLRENTVLLGMGVNMLPGLVGDADIPVELLNPSFYWIGEHAVPTEGDYDLGQAALRFKTLAARIPFTRRAEKQSTPGIEGLLARSLRIGAGIALENTAFNGAGTATEPEGILNTTGIGSVVSSPDGGTTPGPYERGFLVDLRADLGVANAMAAGAALFMSEYSAAQYVKEEISAGSAQFVARYSNDDPTTVETVVGRGHISNLLPNVGKGDAASTVIYGKPSSIYIGMWGAMELDVDRTTDRDKGGTTLRVFLDADMAIPQPANWSAIEDLS